MPKQTIHCKNCDSDIGTQGIYRRETIPHTKRCKWLRVDLTYCPACGAISVYSQDYKDAVIVLKTEEEKIRADIKEMLIVGFTEKTKGGAGVMKRQLGRIHKKYPSFPQEELNVLFTEADKESWPGNTLER